jgi:glycosyltransferase involved in cell wall biosynthesis
LKIAFYIEKFLQVKGGGAERSLAELMTEMCRRGHDVTLIVREPEASADVKPFYELHPEVRVRNLCNPRQAKMIRSPPPVEQDGERALRNFFLRLQRSLRKRFGSIPLREVLEDVSADLVVVFLVSHFTFVSRAVTDMEIPLVLCHRNDPAAKLKELNNKRSTRLDGLSAAYARAALVAVQLESYKKLLPPEVQKKTVVIPNVSNMSSAVPLLDPHAERKNIILSVGRLAPVKNHALLITAFAKIAQRHPEWCVEIYGDGSERSALQALIHNEGLEHRIHLKGTVNNLDQTYRQARIFAFPSYYEGFSRALAEAMAHKLPSVCLRECTFSREVVNQSNGGILTEDLLDDYAAALERLISNPELRQEMGSSGHEYIGAFSPQVIYTAWESTFYQAIG